MNRAILSAAIACLALYAAAGFAQDADKPADPAPAAEPSAEDRLNELLKRRNENPLIEPSRPDPAVRQEGDPAAPAAIRGTNPGIDKVQLRREGVFVTMRRGRLVPATGGVTGWMYAFDADSQALADPPMFLMPCRQLEEMETIAKGRENAVFLLSGQVYVYHGANYLLPTIVKLAPNRGNIAP